MNTFEALVGISQTILRVRGQWCVDGIDETLRRDIAQTVPEAGRLLRLCGREQSLIDLAIIELERRATPWCERSPIIP
jgi:hypothetical protein